MDKPLTMMLATTLRGPGLSCLFVMLNLPPHKIGPKELSTLTGYDRKSVVKGLEKLAALGLASKNGSRYDSWYLTDQGYQLNLYTAYPQSEREGEKLPLPACSSSSSLLREGKKLPLDFTTTTTSEGEKLLLAALISRGCPSRLAQAAVNAALERGQSLADVETEIEAWFAYCESDQGKSVNNPPIFIAAKIKNGEPAPETGPAEEEIQWIR